MTDGLTPTPAATPPTPAPTLPEPVPAMPPAPTTTPEPGKPDKYAEMRRERDAATKRAAQLEAANAERERKEAEERGEHEKIAQQERERADAADKRVSELEQSITIKDIAAELNFRNPSDALSLLPTDVDRSSADAVREGLVQLAADREYLIATGQPTPPPPSGSPQGRTPTGTPTPLTAEMLNDMSPQQISALDQAEVNKVLAGG